MKLYIDKENLRSFIQSKSDPDFEECVRLVIRNMDVQYNFSKSRDDIVHDPELSYWFGKYGSGAGTTFCPPSDIKPTRPLKNNYFTGKSITELSSVYLINDANVDNIKSKHNVLIGKVGEEVSTLKLLLIDSSSKLSCYIGSWKGFCPELPMTDVILCDNHYFKHKEVYDNNNNELIRLLASIPNKSPLHIVIITKTGEIDPKIDLAEEQKRIRNIVVEGTDSTKSSVIIATTYKDHGRNLISNYFRIDHGTCFHLKGNNIKGNDVTSRKSNAIRGEEETTLHLIQFFQDVISNCNELYGNYHGNLLKIKER